jgi:hypothetical protein
MPLVVARPHARRHSHLPATRAVHCSDEQVACRQLFTVGAYIVRDVIVRSFDHVAVYLSVNFHWTPESYPGASWPVKGYSELGRFRLVPPKLLTINNLQLR